MDSTARIDVSTSFTLELRNRRQSASDDGQQDLFAQALGQHMAKIQDETAARYSVTTVRTPDRADRTAKSPTPNNAPASQPARDPQPADDAPASVSRETLSGKKPAPSAQGTAAKAPPAGTKTSSPAKTTASANTPATAATNPAPDDKNAVETAAAADGAAAPVLTGADAEAKSTTPATDAGTDKPATAAPDAAVPAVSPNPVQPSPATAPVPTVPVVAVTQPTVLLLSGVPSAGDATTADPVSADPQALAALLAKLPVTETAAAATPKAAANGTAAEGDPNEIGDGETPAKLGQAKPSAPAATDRVTTAPVKPKAKTAGQNAASSEQADAIKPATSQQVPLTAFAQATTGSGRGITLPEGMGVNEEGEIGAGDLEFSGWGEQLAPGLASALGRGANLQQSAFLAQLKQNVQLMQPHEQVAVQIQRAAQSGIGRLTVDLQPAELGRVEIKMSVDKDKNVTASVVVDRPATLDLLQRDARNLERILQDAGLQTGSGSLSFSLRNSGGDGQGQNEGGGGTGNQGDTAGTDAAAAASAAARPTVVATADGYVDLET